MFTNIFKGIHSSFKSTIEAHPDQDRQETLTKFVSRAPPRKNTCNRNSTPKPFALSIFRNWEMDYSPIQCQDESHISFYQSFHSLFQYSDKSHEAVYKSTQQTLERGNSTSSCDSHFETISDESEDSFEIEYKRPREPYDDEDDDQKESKKFRVSDLHGKPVKNLFEVIAAIEEGEITI